MTGEQCQNERPKRRCSHGMAREDRGQKYGKRMPAATALVAVGTEDALSAHHSSRRTGGIVTIENAVADQVSKAGAARAWHLLKRKSRPARVGTSAAKRIGKSDIPSIAEGDRRPCRAVFLTALPRNGTRVRDNLRETDGTGETALCPRSDRNQSELFNRSSLRKQCFLRRH